jgi:hypothetical protein
LRQHENGRHHKRSQNHPEKKPQAKRQTKSTPKIATPIAAIPIGFPQLLTARALLGRNYAKAFTPLTILINSSDGPKDSRLTVGRNMTHSLTWNTEFREKRGQLTKKTMWKTSGGATWRDDSIGKKLQAYPDFLKRHRTIAAGSHKSRERSKPIAGRNIACQFSFTIGTLREQSRAPLNLYTWAEIDWVDCSDVNFEPSVCSRPNDGTRRDRKTGCGDRARSERTGAPIFLATSVDSRAVHQLHDVGRNRLAHLETCLTARQPRSFRSLSALPG